jgi:hypothetical protein
MVIDQPHGPTQPPSYCAADPLLLGDLLQQAELLPVLPALP